MIDLRRLQVLRVLAARGTVTAAAASLHLTPSAVSQQIRLLSGELDVELLSHEGRRVRLTPAAEALLAHADDLHARWEETRAALAAFKDGEGGTLRVCGVSSAIAALVAPAAGALHDQGVELRIAEEETKDCFDALLTGEADIAVVLPTPDVPPADDPRFEPSFLLDDRLDLLVRRGHPLARRRRIGLADAAGESWVVKARDNDTYAVLLAACAAAGFTPRIGHQVKEWYAVSATVAAGLGVCLLPRMVPIPAAHPVRRLTLAGEPRPSRRISAYVRRGSAGHPVVARGLAALRAVSG
ncbi:MAG TPA: LysR substrate-binding domain-containing protein [Amycolatopsis sp.]|uniref:LysR family transcriptional regulator n=1 Tax=Amycolatopsis sp. TaxID=37632 RepID=UPI002F424E78